MRWNILAYSLFVEAFFFEFLYEFFIGDFSKVKTNANINFWEIKIRD